MTFQQGISGNPHGNRHRTRHLLNQEFMQALLLNFRHEGKKAIEKVARNQPAAYLSGERNLVVLDPGDVLDNALAVRCPGIDAERGVSSPSGHLLWPVCP